MMSGHGKFIIFAALVPFVTCVAPVFEHAEIEKGFHGSGGAAFFYGEGPYGPIDVSDFPRHGAYCAARLQTLLSYGFSPRFSPFLQAGGLLGVYTDDATYYPKTFRGDIDVSLGVKWAPAQGAAIKLSTGFPSIYDFSFLGDIGKNVTVSLGLRPMPFFWGGITFHIPLKENGPELRTFAGGGYMALDTYSLQIGIGIGK